MIDFCNTEDAPLLIHDIDLVIQEIDMLFSTSEGEVLGDETYGSNFESLLWDMNASDAYIEEYVYGQLAKVNMHGYAPSVKVSTYQGTMNDIILIQISLRKDDEVWTKIYNIS